MFGLGTGELLLVLLILLLLFGATRLPKLSKSIGESARELRKGMNGETDTKETKKTADKKK